MKNETNMPIGSIRKILTVHGLYAYASKFTLTPEQLVDLMEAAFIEGFIQAQPKAD